MSFTSCLVVLIGGALGSLARYAVAFWALPISGRLPWGTIIINIVGSFIIGFFGTLTVAHGRYPASDNLRLFVMVGLCGGFTTFSSFSLQTLDLMRAGAYGRAMINIGVSVVVCVLAVTAGHLIASKFSGGEQKIAQTMIEEDAA